MSNTQNIEEDINFDDLNENTQNEIKSNKSKPTKPVKKKKGLMAVLVPSSGKERTNDGETFDSSHSRDTGLVPPCGGGKVFRGRNGFCGMRPFQAGPRGDRGGTGRLRSDGHRKFDRRIAPAEPQVVGIARAEDHR